MLDPVPLTPGVWTGDTLVPKLNYSVDHTFAVTDTHREVWFYMKKSKADTSDPDLFVKRGSAPTRQTYDGHDQRIVDEHSVRFRRGAAAQALETGTYFANAYGYENVDTNVTFMVEAYNCINRNCGASQNAGTCASATGVCSCNAGWNIAEDCSAQLFTAEPAKTYTNTLSSGASAYYKFPALTDDGYELAFAGSREGTSGQGYIVAALGRVPTLSDNDAVQSIYWGQQDFYLAIPTAQYVGGDWYVAIIAPTTAEMKYTFTGYLHMCPAGCSGHGKCNETTFQCTCDEGYDSQPDCSLSATALTHQAPISAVVQPYVTLYFSVSVPEAYAAASVEMSIIAAASQVGTAYTRLYLRHNGQPDMTHYDLVSAQPATQVQSMYVPAAQLQKGFYTLAVESLAASALNYTFTLKFDPNCPAKCSEHGRCTALGECVCDEGYMGKDCQINSKICQVR